MSDSDPSRGRLIGVNHLVVEVGDLGAALDFYRDLFAFDLRGQSTTKAFLDMGDQFLVLAEVDDAGDRDRERHVGLVVDDPGAVERRLDSLGIDRLDSTTGLDVHDPWGNRLQIVGYERIQFTKADHVARGMGIDDLEKTEGALAELAEKGLAPD